MDGCQTGTGSTYTREPALVHLTHPSDRCTDVDVGLLPLGEYMAGYVEREARINRHRHAQVNLCGDCGKEISATELLCRDCRHKPMVDDTFIDTAGRIVQVRVN